MDAITVVGMGERLARDLAEVLPERRTRRWRCPVELKSRVVAYAKLCREGGEPIDDIATRLGLLGATVARWLRWDSRGATAGFRSVAIVAAGDEGEHAVGQCLRLVSPRGYCVEGLDAQTLAYVLRVVG